MSDYLPPPERPGLGSTFKRPVHTLIIGTPPSSPGLIITDQVPSELTTFYTTAPHGALSVTSAAILIYPEANIYFYLVTGTTPAGDFLGLGAVVGGTVTEAFYIENDPGLGVFFDFSPLTAQFGSFLTTAINIVRGSDLQYDNRSLSRGIIAIGTSTASVTGISTSLAQIMSTDVPAARYDTGRAYRLHIHIPLIVSIASGDVIARWRETNGTVIRPQQTVIRTLAVGSIWTYDESVVFVNTSGAPITTHILIEIATTGTANLASSVSAAAPGRFEVEDIGDAARFPNAPSMA